MLSTKGVRARTSKFSDGARARWPGHLPGRGRGRQRGRSPFAPHGRRVGAAAGRTGTPLGCQSAPKGGMV